VPSLMHRRRVLGDRITYVGLDVHKDGIVVAVAEGGLRDEVREYGRIANTPAGLRRLAHKLSHQGMALRFCYEAGPCGYGIQRQLSASGHDCVVVAPSLIPKRAGDRVKTNRRDACSLAKLHRAGELMAVCIVDVGCKQQFASWGCVDAFDAISGLPHGVRCSPAPTRGPGSSSRTWNMHPADRIGIARSWAPSAERMLTSAPFPPGSPATLRHRSLRLGSSVPSIVPLRIVEPTNIDARLSGEARESA
jgi:hypothetical protein